MDYGKIRLSNERNQHVTKRLNRLSTWKFFKVIYRENIWRMFGYNFLMLFLIAPIFVVGLWNSFNLSSIQHTLPLYNGFGFSTGAWAFGDGIASVNDFLVLQIRNNNIIMGAWMVLSSLLITFMFSGGFAVIRDAFWTGKLSAVGVFRSMWKGIKANILYAFLTNVSIAGMVYGLYIMFIYISQQLDLLWLAIVLAIVLGIAALFVAMYLLILCSVSVTYKQSVYENMDDAWRLLWLNVWPNLIHMLIALIPFVLYVALGGTMFQQLVGILLIMFGGLYFPFVWQTHMMKTFALFHPIEIKKKKQVKAETQTEEVTDELPAENAADKADSTEEKGKKRSKHSKKQQPEQPQDGEDTVPEGDSAR